MRIKREAVPALASTVAALGAAVVAGFIVAAASGSIVRPFANPYFLAGLAILLLCVLLLATHVFARAEIEPRHQQDLLFDLDHSMAVVREGHVKEPSPQFRAHFRLLTRDLEVWNAAIKRWDQAQGNLARRYEGEIAARDLDRAPFRCELIPRGLVELCVSRWMPKGFFSGRASVALELRSWFTFADGAQAPSEGGWHWAIDPSALADETSGTHVERLLASVTQIVDDSTAWPEVTLAKQATAAVMEFDRDSLLQAILATDINHKRRCPTCRTRRRK